MPEHTILTVSQLTRQVKDLLEANFPLVWVAGEISNCTRAGSGHVYLTLKDDEAQLRAVIWRSTAARLKFDVQDGMHVVAAGSLELYQPRGTYQLIVQQLVPQGIGALELAFRQLQEKLAREGLFDPQRKRPLPRFPRRIALVTSPSGAAVRDMLQVITRRWRASDVVIVPVAVQGDGAAVQIAAALAVVPRLPRVDVVIVGRGGGSLEDLWAFNEEIVARAICTCPLPVISAVGHEIDVTIADLVADRRALTPSEAGELVVPLQAEVLAHLERQRGRLCAALRDRVARARLQLDALASRRVLARPLERLHDWTGRLDELSLRLRRAAGQRVLAARHLLTQRSAALEALSPLKVLSRGYSVTRNAETGETIRTADQLQPGMSLQTLFHRGRATSTVVAIDSESAAS